MNSTRNLVVTALLVMLGPGLRTQAAALAQGTTTDAIQDKDKDKEKFAGNEELWSDTENILRDVLKELKVEYEEVAGEVDFGIWIAKRFPGLAARATPEP